MMVQQVPEWMNEIQPILSKVKQGDFQMSNMFVDDDDDDFEDDDEFEDDEFEDDEFEDDFEDDDE